MKLSDDIGVDWSWPGWLLRPVTLKWCGKEHKDLYNHELLPQVHTDEFSALKKLCCMDMVYLEIMAYSSVYLGEKNWKPTTYTYIWHLAN